VRKSERGSSIFVFYCIFVLQFSKSFEGVHEVPPLLPPLPPPVCINDTLPLQPSSISSTNFKVLEQQMSQVPVCDSGSSIEVPGWVLALEIVFGSDSVCLAVNMKLNFY
jgi:hypothetical protein